MAYLSAKEILEETGIADSWFMERVNGEGESKTLAAKLYQDFMEFAANAGIEHIDLVSPKAFGRYLEANYMPVKTRHSKGIIYHGWELREQPRQSGS